MNKKECPSCAMQVPDMADVCPICGYEFAETVSNRKKIILMALFFLALVVFIFILARK
jgi:predicted amidophosphoribosyltransferase